MADGLDHRVAEIGIGQRWSSGKLGTFVMETRWSRGTLFPVGRMEAPVSGCGHRRPASTATCSLGHQTTEGPWTGNSEEGIAR